MFTCVQRFERLQYLKAPLADCWQFFSNPQNLPIITPTDLDFVVLDPEEKIHGGLILRYFVRPLFGVRLSWVTEITHVEKERYFVDEQRFGPYRFWHHQHIFQAIPGGTRMQDIVHYAIPVAPFGRWIMGRTVERQLEKIFDFRREVLASRFGEIASASSGLLRMSHSAGQGGAPAEAAELP